MPLPPLLVVEGVEDEAFLKKLIEVRGLRDATFSVTGGVDKFTSVLLGLTVKTHFEQHRAMVVVADNDGNPQGRFREVQDALRTAGFPVPSRPRETISHKGVPVSVLMLPWDNDAGCLESLCLRGLNPKYAAALACVESHVDCIQARNWDVQKLEKLRMRCLLSSVCQTDPNTGLRYAWTTNGGRPGDIFSLDQAHFNDLVNYLAAIFG